VTTLAAGFTQPAGIAFDSLGLAYVADAAAHTIPVVTPGGAVTRHAGLPNQAGAAPGSGDAARFDTPTRIHFDNANTLHIADTGNHLIRTEDANRSMLLYAGRAGTSGTADGYAPDARLNHPQGMTGDSAGNIYFADTGNHTIRVLSHDGEVLTLAGTPGAAGLRDGPGATALFDHPADVVFAGANILYVADAGNALIRKITLTGAQFSNVQVTTLPLAAETPRPAPAPAPEKGDDGAGAPGLPLLAAMAALAALRAGKQRNDVRKTARIIDSQPF
jgi:sugar lactone lactonase YvrE